MQRQITFDSVSLSDGDELASLRVESMREAGRFHRGPETASLRAVFAQADRDGLSLRVGATKDSASNRFHARHGLVLLEQGDFDNYDFRAPFAAAAPPNTNETG